MLLRGVLRQYRSSDGRRRRRTGVEYRGLPLVACPTGLARLTSAVF